MSDEIRNDEILIVDDQPEVLDHLRKQLTVRGFRVHCAPDSDSALKAFRKRFDELTVFSGFVTACRFAGIPISRSSPL